MIPHLTYNECELLHRVHAGDVEAFTTIYRKYASNLLNTAAKVVRDGVVAEDILQDVFLSLWNRRDQLNIEGSLEAYLHSSVRYKALTYIRKNLSLRDYHRVFEEVLTETATADIPAGLEAKELQALIHEAIRHMPPKMQLAYILSRHEQHSHREIAEKLGIAEQTVKKQVHYALHIIKNSISKYLLLFFYFF